MKTIECISVAGRGVFKIYDGDNMLCNVPFNENTKNARRILCEAITAALGKGGFVFPNDVVSTETLIDDNQQRVLGDRSEDR